MGNSWAVGGGGGIGGVTRDRVIKSRLIIADICQGSANESSNSSLVRKASVIVPVLVSREARRRQARWRRTRASSWWSPRCSSLKFRQGRPTEVIGKRETPLRRDVFVELLQYVISDGFVISRWDDRSSRSSQVKLA